jgi:hypothetical protein
MGQNTAVLDISEPANPRLISITANPYGAMPGYFDQPGESRTVNERLPQVPGLDPRHRLEAMRGPNMALDGDVLCIADREAIDTWRLIRIDERIAQFEHTGHYEPALLEHVFGSWWPSPVAANGFVYLTGELSARTGGFTFDAPRINVFDVRNPTRPQQVGHFAVPGKTGPVVGPLPDGRALVGADNTLYLVGKPKGGE